MPKQVPIITDWSEAERLALVQKWHPDSDVKRSPALDKSLGNGSDQECWYDVLTPVGLLPGESRTSYYGQQKNNHMYRLTVKTCLENLGSRP